MPSDFPLRPGRLLYQAWHRPLAALRRSRREGGPVAQFITARGRRAMQDAAAALPPFPARAGNATPLVVHLLTGRRWAYQTAFCLHTLARHCPRPLAAEIYDDGTLDPASRALLTRLSPAVLIHDHPGLRERLDRFLPASRFPSLRDRWAHYPHIRKLIDVHLGREGWRLVLDSDLLFWREPRFLLDWAAAPDRPLHAVDCSENYGYSSALLADIAGAPIPPLVNVGLCGLRSDALDWDFLEHASARLIREQGTSYYLEQGLVALLAARAPAGCAAAPAGDYVTLPGPDEIARPAAVMHHYVDTARAGYLRHAWRLAVSART